MHPAISKLLLPDKCLPGCSKMKALGTVACILDVAILGDGKARNIKCNAWRMEDRVADKKLANYIRSTHLGKI